MQRKLVLIAYFFYCAGCYGQQYPFVYYTPNEGLISSRIRNIKQDSRGRIYFITYGGLSVYDGTRFTNYGKEEGLANELVNDLVEAGDDSLLLATNTQKLNTLVRGKVGIYKTTDGFYPVVNRFLKSSDGSWYVAGDDGFFLLANNKFTRLPLMDPAGTDIGKYLDGIIEWKNFILLMPWNPQNKRTLFLYDRQKKKLADIYSGTPVFGIIKDKQENIWVSLGEGIKMINTKALEDGSIQLEEPPEKYSLMKDVKNVMPFFDSENNTWLFGNSMLQKISPQLQVETISGNINLKGGSLLNMFEDREGIIWIASDGNGAIKIKGTDLQFITEHDGHPFFISGAGEEGDTTWLFNSGDNAIWRISKNSFLSFPVRQKMKAANLYVFNKKLYLVDEKNIFCVEDKNDPHAISNPVNIYKTQEFALGTGIVDYYGSLIQLVKKNDSTYSLLVFRNNKQIFEQPVGFSTDQMALDKAGNLWLATRLNHLMAFTIHPDQLSSYLRLSKDFSKELFSLNPRSIVIDDHSNIWVGTRNDGIFEFHVNGNQLQRILRLTTANGLTDNFVFTLSRDADNNIWAGTQSGLDKIFLKGGHYIVNNISRSNNFFQSIRRIIINEDNTVWTLTNEGTLIKIYPYNKQLPSPPPVWISLLKVNDQLYSDSVVEFSYQENNFLFSVAAPSFTDERSISYSYLLSGSSHEKWTEPSHNGNFNFINLPPGNYTLRVKVEFPAAMYDPQYSSFSFIILPPWWQTWWFRTIAVVVIITIAVLIVRMYYRRKLQLQKNILEKRQAIEKERTRIATDMHDDLGAGLSRIKFLSETIGIKKQRQLPIEEDIGKIREYSHEMIDKMGEIVWALNEKNDSLSDLLSYTRSYAVEYLSENGIDYEVDMPENLPGEFVSGEFRQNIFLSVKEILHNIIKHAQASQVKISVRYDHSLRIQIDDNGIGFDPGKIRLYSNGLTNIRKRMKDIGGEIQVHSEGGTKINLSAPIAP